MSSTKSFFFHCFETLLLKDNDWVRNNKVNRLVENFKNFVLEIIKLTINCFICRLKVLSNGTGGGL